MNPTISEALATIRAMLEGSVEWSIEIDRPVVEVWPSVTDPGAGTFRKFVPGPLATIVIEVRS